MTVQATAPRDWTLCADDFGWLPEINQGIVELAQAGRLGAISCMSTAPHWSAGAPALAELRPQVRIGLHLNFTDGRPASAFLARSWPQFPSLPHLLALALAGALPRAGLLDEVQAQVHRFWIATGTLPDYVDGHQHAHHLPGVRDVVLDVVNRLFPRPAVRDSAALQGPGSGFKRWVIRNSGARGLRRELVREGLLLNRELLGIYDFRAQDYGRLMRHWLAQLPAQDGWICCHPAAPGSGARGDRIAAARVREYDYLKSPQFPQDLHAAGLTPQTSSAG